MPTVRKAARAFSLGFLLLVGLFAARSLLQNPGSFSSDSSVGPSTLAVSAAESRNILGTYARLPLSFEENRGQGDPHVQFLSRTYGLSVFLGSGDATFLFGKTSSREPAGDFDPGRLDEFRLFYGLLAQDDEWSPRELPAPTPAATQSVRMSLVGARPDLQAEGFDLLPAKANYFLGKDATKWQTNVETFAKVRYRDVYQGIDLVYYGNQQRLEYDFVVSPGSDPKQIRFALEGVDHVAVDASSGDLVTQTDGSELRFLRPSVYQVDDERFSANAANKRTIDGQYVLLAGNHIGFQIGPYDSAKPLIIDPIIGFFTYLGGMLPDVALHVAADASGVYLTGFTTSPDFPTSPAGGSTYHTAMCGSGAKSFPCPDAFVTKLKPDGSGILYSTYLGGTRSDIGIGIAVDGSQQAYVVGETESLDFPTTSSGFQPTESSRLTRAFLTKLNSRFCIPHISVELPEVAARTIKRTILLLPRLLLTIVDTLTFRAIRGPIRCLQRRE